MIGNDWDIYLKEEYNKDYFKKLIDFVNKEYKEIHIMENIKQKVYLFLLKMVLESLHHCKISLRN